MNGSLMFQVSLIALTAVVGAAFLYAVRWVDRRRDQGEGSRYFGRVGVGVGVWLAATAVAGAGGLLRFEPPTMLLLLGAGTALTVFTAFSKVGTRIAAGIPLAALVGFQAFRIPVELWLHWGYEQGVFPIQMTFAGLNFDIVSGITALIVAVIIRKRQSPAPLVLAWNVLGLALLATIVTIALLSAPLPFRVFTDGPPNVWITGFPGAWLPAGLVQAALLGHLLVFRRLASVRRHAEVGRASVATA